MSLPTASNTDHAMADIVNKFLAWPLPQSVCADGCATRSDYPHPRSGTNLLNCPQTLQMVQEVVRPIIEQLLAVELADARADKARLDWLAEHSYRQGGTADHGPLYVIAHSSVWPPALKGPDVFRAAIDAARQ